VSKQDDEFDDFEALLAESARVAAEFDSADSDDYAESIQPDLVERNALRRVKGFSTQLQDISEAEYRELQLEKVVLVGVWTEGNSTMAENSLAELKALAETAGSEVMEGLIQRGNSQPSSNYPQSRRQLRQLFLTGARDTQPQRCLAAGLKNL
jgi:GTP-binding protein HflX